jgi:uncharacterized protein YbcV (DUF1398 family)
VIRKNSKSPRRKKPETLSNLKTIIMELKDKIQECYKKATSYPDLVKHLIQVGIESYTVDVSSSTILYRLAQGQTMLHPGTAEIRIIENTFDKNKTIQAIRNNQQGKTDYPGFMKEIAGAGVRFYEATLIGSNKRVTYIGTGGFYEEAIPI